MPNPATESREHVLERYIYLRAIENLIGTLCVGAYSVPTLDGPPLDGMPGEPDDGDSLYDDYLVRLSRDEGETLRDELKSERGERPCGAAGVLAHRPDALVGLPVPPSSAQATPTRTSPESPP